MSWRADVEAQLGDFRLDVCLEVEAKILAIVGPNGSGKTTFLRTLSGAVENAAGSIEIGERTILRPDGVSTPIEERRIAYVPQGYGLFPHLDVFENVAFGLTQARPRIDANVQEKRARAILDEMEITQLSRRSIEGLSGGEKQRVALARALVLEPDLLLLDEPLGALDATARRRMRSFLADKLVSLDCATLIVSHDVRDVEALGAEIAVFEQGEVVQEGSIDELRDEPANDFVAEFCSA